MVRKLVVFGGVFFPSIDYAAFQTHRILDTDGQAAMKY